MSDPQLLTYWWVIAFGVARPRWPVLPQGTAPIFPSTGPQATPSGLAASSGFGGGLVRTWCEADRLSPLLQLHQEIVPLRHRLVHQQMNNAGTVKLLIAR